MSRNQSVSSSSRPSRASNTTNRGWLVSALAVVLMLGAFSFGSTSCGASHVNPKGPSLRAPGALLPARLRRLSNAEFANVAQRLLEGEVSVHERLPPDVRQNGYTQNAEQTLPAALGTRIASLADDLAHEAVSQRFSRLYPCAANDVACRRTTLENLALEAWRRPPSRQEVAALLELYAIGARDGGPPLGLELVLSTLLQSPSLWYLSEGQAGGERSDLGPGTVELAPGEIASSLAFTISGGPPDKELLDLAQTPALKDPEVRERQARRLLGRTETRHHFRRFVLEWLEVDGLNETAKDAELFPAYDAVKASMLEETSDFVDEVMVREGASVRALLTAGFASVNPIMARYYSFDSYGPRVDLDGSGRLGVLQQASFLSTHAHPDSTSPVKRGDFVLRKVLCDATPRPRELDIEVTIPPPDPAHTTRERFFRHAEDPACAFCHIKIDGFGFSFETFDAAGRQRSEDNRKPVDSNVRFSFGGEQVAFGNSAQVARWLADNPRTNECFARQAFRFFSAQGDPKVEESFLALTNALPPSHRENLLEMIVAFVSSDLFLIRRLNTAP